MAVEMCRGNVMIRLCFVNPFPANDVFLNKNCLVMLLR